METTKQDALSDLAQFTGTEHYFGYLGGIKLTDGTKYVADTAGAYWLLDIIASAQLLSEVKAESFQTWKLTVADAKGVVTCGDGNRREVYRQDISFTDFPAAEIQFYLTDNVLMLPSEY